MNRSQGSDFCLFSSGGLSLKQYPDHTIPLPLKKKKVKIKEISPKGWEIECLFLLLFSY